MFSNPPTKESKTEKLTNQSSETNMILITMKEELSHGRNCVKERDKKKIGLIHNKFSPVVLGLVGQFGIS